MQKVSVFGDSSTLPFFFVAALSRNPCVVSLNLGNVDNSTRNRFKERGALAVSALLSLETCTLSELSIDSIGAQAAFTILMHGAFYNPSFSFFQ